MAGGPLSSRTTGWKLHDYLFAIFIVILLTALLTTAIHTFAPTSQLGLDIHKAGQATGNVLKWLADGLLIVAGWFLQL